MTSPERLNALIRSVEYVVAQKIPGDIVECGVWRGGSMMAVAYTLLRLNVTDRDLYLFDTFEGMSTPTEVDIDNVGQHAGTLLATEDRKTSAVWAVASYEDVVRNLRATSYPSDKLHFVRGKVEDTIPDQAPQTISVLRLDTDWYESTKHELVHLFPRLAKGGILIIDDYGHWKGARKAVDEFLRALSVPIFLHWIDYTGRLAVKPFDESA